MKYTITTTEHADLLNRLDQLKIDTLSSGSWAPLDAAQRLILSQEQLVSDLRHGIKIRDHRTRHRGPYYHGTYVGPIKAWQGKTAMLQDITLAQFDDRGQYTAYGWHGFKKSDFVKQKEPVAPLFQALATICQARKTCGDRRNENPSDHNSEQWFAEWADRAEALVKEHMPSGSDFDAGTALDLDESGPLRLVFITSFHHMDSFGGYDGWTEHQVIVTPSLVHGFELRVTGRNRNGIKGHITEVFGSALMKEVDKYGRD